MIYIAAATVVAAATKVAAVAAAVVALCPATVAANILFPQHPVRELLCARPTHSTAAAGTTFRGPSGLRSVASGITLRAGAAIRSTKIVLHCTQPARTHGMLFQEPRRESAKMDMCVRVWVCKYYIEWVSA